MRSSNQKENLLQNSSRKMSNYIKTTLGTNSKVNNESFSQSKNTLNDLENQLQYIVRVKTYLSQFSIKKEIKQEVKEHREPYLDRQTQLVQTGNFGHPESQLSHRISTQRTLPAFEITEDIPSVEDLRKLQNFVLDSNTFNVDCMDELKRLSSIIMFRLRNLQS